MSFQQGARAALAAKNRAYWMLVAVTLILASLSASCGNSSNSSSASHNAYVTFPTRGSVALLHLNDSTGVISLGPETPSVQNTSPTGVALDPGKKFLYVGNSADSTLTIFNVGGDGSLTQSGDAIPLGAGPRTLAIDASGKYLLITDTLAQTVSVYSLNAGSGAITFLASYPASPGPTEMAISPTSNFVYISNPTATGGLITAYSLDSGTGTLTPIPGSPFPAGNGVAGLAVDSGGRYLYAANSSDNTVSAYRISHETLDNGALSAISGSPYLLGTAQTPRAVAIDPSGTFLYVANAGTNNVSAFSITSSTGQLTTITGSPFSAGTEPVFVLAEPAGKYLYIGNQKSTNITGFSYDSTTGKLTAISGSPFTIPAGPGAMTIAH
jgi:6-phosphogluconolactonase